MYGSECFFDLEGEFACFLFICIATRMISVLLLVRICISKNFVLVVKKINKFFRTVFKHIYFAKTLILSELYV